MTGLLLGALALLAACDNAEHAAPPPEEGLLAVERAYTNQTLEEGGTAEYRFHAKERGAYLIMVYGNPEPLSITLEHPKRTCYLLGNGSCELVSGPDERYGFRVTADSGRAARFSVMVTHSEGTGRYEGEVTQPVALAPNAQHKGTVGVHESSYYRFVPRYDGSHTISLSGTQSDLVWRLFDAPDFDVIVQECDYQSGAADESCRTVQLYSDRPYYVKVEELSGVPGPYHLTVFSP